MVEALLHNNIKNYKQPGQVTIYLSVMVTFYYYAFKYRNSMILNAIEL